MFRDLDETLRTMLDDPATPNELRNADISFEPPDRNFTPSQATVNLFLYDVRENRVLRDPVPVIERVGGLFVRRTPPLRVDCSYLITTWTTGTGAARVAEEHRLLSQALLWLSRFPIIPDQFLQGSLVNPPFPHPTMVAQTNDGKNMGEFWTALEQPPRPSFNLVVTIAMDLAIESPEGPLVITKDMRMGQKDGSAPPEQWFQIGGTVTDADSPPGLIAGAEVRLVERDLTTLTNDQGRFTFTLLPGGNYTLEVSKAGFATTSKNITIPGASLDAYDVLLLP